VTAFSGESLAAMVAAPCPGCGGRRLRVHAIAPGTMPFLDGEPAAAMAWAWHRLEARDRADELARVAERTVRVECVDCKRELLVREACPLCGAAGGAARASGGRHGAKAPRECPICQYGELDHTVEARMHLDFLNGTVARRVLDAEPADPTERGWHVRQVVCRNCEATVAAAAEIACVACGRSSLVRRRS
jgi:hypothetical protein